MHNDEVSPDQIHEALKNKNIDYRFEVDVFTAAIEKRFDAGFKDSIDLFIEKQNGRYVGHVSGNGRDIEGVNPIIAIDEYYTSKLQLETNV